MILTRKAKVLLETHPNAKSSTLNPAWAALKRNPGLRGDRLATDRLIHGTI
jgi:hypothetical protein